MGLKFRQMEQQGPSKKCNRCGLSYFAKHHELCPHCTELDDEELRLLIRNQRNEAKANAQLGHKMGLYAIILLMFLVLALL